MNEISAVDIHAWLVRTYGSNWSLSDAELDAFRDGVKYADDTANPLTARVAELEAALLMSAGRWDDMAEVIDESGPYNNARFCRASAERARAALKP